MIITEDLSRSYGSRLAVSAVNLRIGQGEIFGFLGPNGAGKTTTIRLLMGFLQPSQGRASIFGLDCWRDSANLKRDVGYLPGDVRLYAWLTGRKALRILSLIRGVDLRRPGEELAERFQFEMDLPARHMSRGTRQKLGLIMALVHRPRLLILDEPTSGLDPLMQVELSHQLRSLAAAGHTVFFSSHTLSEVEALCDRVAIVRRGRIVADESLDALRGRARRVVSLSFSNETAAGTPLPAFLTRSRRHGRKIACELEGPTPPLVEWAARQPLDDIGISPPDLETLFHQYYDAPHEDPS